jgi:peptidoglycan-N-acetylglucosamine deacetylase
LGKRTIFHLWMKWEQLFHFVYKVKPVDKGNPLLQIRTCTYKGRPLLLNDGEELRRGDRIIELHFDNETLAKLAAGSKSSVHLAIHLIRGTEQLLPQIADRIRTQFVYKDVKALYGISHIYRGTEKLGFTVVEMQRGVFRFLTKYYLRLLLSVVHPEGRKRVEKKTELIVPKIIAFSAKKLLEKY